MTRQYLDLAGCHAELMSKKLNQVMVGLAIHRGRRDADLETRPPRAVNRSEQFIAAGMGLNSN